MSDEILEQYDFQKGQDKVKSRIIYMDLLSVVSCMAVVWLHCSTVVFLNEGDLLWFLSVVVQACFCFAVPVFFMVSGANLLGYREKYDTLTFLKKRMKRVIVPLVGFSLLYYVLSCFVPGVFGLPSRELDIAVFLSDLLTNRICDVYWFMYAIVGLYLVTPLLSRAADDKQLLHYLLLLSFFSTSIVPLVNRFSPDHSLLNLFAVPYLNGPIFFYMLGYYIHRYVNVGNLSRRALGLSLLASLAVMIVMTLKTNISHTVASGHFADYDNFYLNIQNVFCIVYSGSLFLLMKSAESSLLKQPIFQGRFFNMLSSVTLYVYLIHMLIINTLDVYFLHSIVWDLIVRPIIVILMSVAFGMLLVFVKKTLNARWLALSIHNREGDSMSLGN